MFSTLYQDINSNYSSVFTTLRTVFDSMIGNYEYGGSGNEEMWFSILSIINLFFISILLLNFMVAILSQTYSEMLESGSFKYKCSLYEYCERYMIAFEEERMGEMVVHAPPLNVLSTLMVPFSFIPVYDDFDIMKFISKGFSYMMFWMENILFVSVFIAFEMCLMPLVWFICFLNIIYSTPGMFTTFFNLAKWIVLGILYMAFILFKDVYNLV